MPLVLTICGLGLVRNYFHIAPSPAAQFFWNSAGYLSSEVYPYLFPLFLAVWLNRNLRTQLFAWASTVAPAEAPAPVEEKKRRRARR